jgi:putative ABC transport system substrate-binding protein
MAAGDNMPFDQVRRREFLGVLGGAVAAWPLAARAQQSGKVVRIGFFGPSLNSPSTAANYQIFLTELRELGFREGENLAVEYQRVDDPRGIFRAAAELVRTQPQLIVVAGPEEALGAVIGASGWIPIVIQAVNFDPVERGYIASLARPGGNITGVVQQQIELTQKEVELLTQAFPERRRLGVLFDAQSADQFKAAEVAAKSLHIEVQAVKLENPPYDFGTAFATLAQGGSQMVLVLSSPFFSEHRPQLAALAIEHRLPSMFIFKAYVEAGGLMSYGVNSAAIYRRTVAYVAKILKGAKPADLPVEQPTKFELVVNLKTANAIGVEIPQVILLRADQVIE